MWTTITDTAGEEVMFGLTKTTMINAAGEKVAFGLTKTTTTDAAGEKVAFGLTKTTTTETQHDCAWHDPPSKITTNNKLLGATEKNHISLMYSSLTPLTPLAYSHPQ